MEYVAVGILVLLLIGGFVTFLVMQATRRSSPATDDTGTDTPGIGTDRATPFGDTSEHADDDSHRTATQDADPPDGRFKRDPVGGEGEGTPSIEGDPPGRPGV
jgi:hypothetical protein